MMNPLEKNSRDQRFLEKIRQIVLDNLTNEQFSVEQLADIHGTSRSQLHKKLKKLEGRSISQFIREMRLEKAMQLLNKDVASVSEIAYQVGFSSPAYFNTCFKDFYGFPPGEAKVRSHLSIPTPAKKTELGRTRQPIKNQNLIVLLVTGILAVVVIGYYVFRNNPVQPESGTPIIMVGKEKNSRKKTIAVLPLKNWSGDPELEYVSDGMTDAVISRLTQIQSIEKVIPFTSMLRYRKTNKSMPEISKELGVTYILEGNFQLSGDQVKIKVQLVDAPDDKRIWSNEYSGEWKSNEIFKMQAGVAENVAEKMNAEITKIEIEAIQKFPTEIKEAYNLYLQAEYLKSKDDANEFENAIPLYERAIALDADFTEAYIGLANTFLAGGFFWGVFDEQEAWEKAKPLLQKALENDRMNIKAHEQLFAGYFYYDWNFDLAERYYNGELFGKELSIRWRQVAIYYAIKTGRSDEALLAVERNIAFDPSDRLQYVQKADALFFLGEIEACSKVLESFNSYFTESFYYLVETAKLCYYLEEHEKAKKHLQLLMDKFPGRPPIVLWLGAVYQNMDGNEKGVKELLSLLHKNYEDYASGSPAWFLALYYSHIEDYENALLWLQKSYDRHEVEMTWLKEEPVLRPLKKNPRYLELYEKVGFSKIGL